MDTNEFIQKAKKYEDELLMQFDNAEDQPLTLGFIGEEAKGDFDSMAAFAKEKGIRVTLICGEENYLQFPGVYNVDTLAELINAR